MSADATMEPLAQAVAAADRFWTDGACVVRGALDATRVAEVRQAIAGLEERGELADLSSLAQLDDAGRFRAGVDHWRADPAFVEFAVRGPLPAIAAAVLRTERLWLYEDSVLVKEAGSDAATRWHTDDGYFHIEGRQLATLWVALDPAPLSAGALRFLERSHLDERRFRPTLFVTDDPIPRTEGELPPQHDLDGPDVIGFDLDPGDLTLHHARTLHAASGNPGPTPRRALSIRYCGDDAVVRPKPGAPAKPGFHSCPPGTPLAEVADRLGLPEAMVTG